MKTYAFRLKPNSLLKQSIYQFAKDNDIRAGIVLCCVGSLKSLKLRLASGREFMNIQEPVEILSLAATFNNNFEGHFHISVADSSGNCFGGHLLDSDIIYTTGEIVLAEIDKKIFLRKMDKETKFKELEIEDDIFR
jgi:predicted DNA-binding protein with PD1-like motif